MRKLCCLLLCGLCLLALLGGCSQPEQEDERKGARRPMVLVEGTLYFDTGIELDDTIDPAVILGAITSSVDRSEIPTEEGQSNFGHVGAPYAYYEDGLLLLLEETWFYYETETAQTVEYHGALFDASALSPETLEWLTWYGDLSPTEQMAISFVPPELITARGEDVPVQDADS